MSWYFGSWQDFLKKKACRYILQHYLGQFLKEKLSLDQLSLDLYNGTGKISELNLDVQAINEDLSNLNVPVELVDGFVDCISVSIPWSSLVMNSTKVEVTGLELTLRPSQRVDSGSAMLSSMTSSFASMTTSLQLAKDCLESEKAQGGQYTSETQPIEGVQKFAQMIDSVLSKIRVKFIDTVVRLEHHPDDAKQGVALELRIRSIEYFDDLATVAEGSSVDGASTTWTPAAICHKNLHMEGIQIFFDETTRKPPPAHCRSDSEGSSPPLSSLPLSSLASADVEGSESSQWKSMGDSQCVDSEPVQIALLTGRQEVKLKTKQSDALQGPKLELSCQFGALHVLLSPRQLHGVLQLVSAVTSPAQRGGTGQSQSCKNKPMNPMDFQRVEMELQHQLQSNRVQSHRQQQDLSSLQSGEDEDQFYSLMSPGRGSDMESSFSSNFSASSNRTASTVPSSTGLSGRQGSRSHKDGHGQIKVHEDPSAELNQYQVRVAFFSVALCHNNPGTSTDGQGRSPADVMRQMSRSYFQSVSAVGVAGLVELKDIRQSFAALLTQDHVRFIGKPLNLDCTQKSALKQQTTSLHLTVGLMEVVENLYDSRVTGNRPEVNELLVFMKSSTESRKNAMYSSMHGATPCLSLDFKTLQQNKAQRRGELPRTDLMISLGEFHTELDLTIIDRVSSLLNPEPYSGNVPPRPSSMYPYGAAPYSITQTLDEGYQTQDSRVHIEVSSPAARVFLRFPIPDLREMPRQSWWQRNLREEILILDLHDCRFDTSFTTNQAPEQLEFTCAEIHGFFKFKANEEPQHFAHISSSEGSEEGFDRPRLAMKFCQKMCSVLDDETFSNDTTPNDSLNGACQFVKPDPSPFSARKSMYGKEAEHDKTEVSEEMVTPGDKDELREFQEKSSNNTDTLLELSLPQICLFLPNQHFYEVLYNRINNDLLLWEPAAPAPVVSQEHFVQSQHVDLNVYTQLLAGDHFEMAQSGLHYDSDSDSEPDSTFYSIHDSRYPRRKKPSRQQQSSLCLSLNIGKGRLTAFTPSKDPAGSVLENKHGEILVQADDVFLFTVANHNGDPSLQYLYVTANRADIYHEACVCDSEVLPIVDCQELHAPVPPHLHQTLYRSERGVLVTTRDEIGCGPDSLDMLSVAVKIRKDTMASKTDLTSDEKVKEFTVSVGVRGATMRHRMALPHQNVFIQLIDFLDVKDYPILGYTDPTVFTELHVHLWTCAVDYRPLKMEVKSVLTAESFSISSNIVAESATSLLRFVLDDGALFLSKKKKQITDLRKDYVCVADVGRLELTLRTHERKDQLFPKTDLRVLTNRLNLRTCPDTLTALIDLIKYLAADGDLDQSETSTALSQSDSSTNITVTQQGEEEDQDGASTDLTSLSESSMDHVHSLMSEAMKESSSTASNSGSPEASTVAPQTEVFFIPDTGQTTGTAPKAGLAPIVITQVDSVTSSTVSDRLSDEEGEGEGDDDFCFITDQAWGQQTGDGEPEIRVFTENVDIKENYFALPQGRTDILKCPDHFPLAECRYTLKELTLVWHMYGGADFEDCVETSPRSSEKVKTQFSSDTGLTLSYHRGSPDRWSGLTGGREVPLVPRETLHTRGGPGRDLSKCMELQLTKVRFQHERYPSNTEQASRQVLLIHDMEVRDRLKSSKINKFLYQFSSEDMPRQTYANMVLFKILHRRPNPAVEEEEASLKVSLQPIRLNIDQDSLFFLHNFFVEMVGGEKEDPYSAGPADTEPKSVANKPVSNAPPPVMTVNKPNPTGDPQSPQDLLMQFDEFAQDLQTSLGGISTTSSGSASSGTVTSTADTDARAAQPVFFKSFVFSPDVPIRLDYHGKFDREHGTLAGLGGLVSLNRSELKLKQLSYKQGILGYDKLFHYCVGEWVKDIRVNQLPTILGGFGPMHSFVQLAAGIRDLFWLPVEQYRKDGRIVRGIKRGAASFSTSTAMSFLELTNRAVQGVQWFAELTFDMVSPGPRRRCFYPKQPSDLREGVTNAYIVLREGFTDTANTLVDAATKEHEQKGVMGAVGGVLRQIPPTIVQPLIIVPEAASNLLGGMRSQLKPDTRKEDEEKWKEEIID